MSERESDVDQSGVRLVVTVCAPDPTELVRQLAEVVDALGPACEVLEIHGDAEPPTATLHVAYADSEALTVQLAEALAEEPEQ